MYEHQQNILAHKIDLQKHLVENLEIGTDAQSF